MEEDFWKKVIHRRETKSRISAIGLILDEFENKLLIKDFDSCKKLIECCPYEEIALAELMGLMTILKPWKNHFIVERDLIYKEAHKKSRLKYSEEETVELLRLK